MVSCMTTKDLNTIALIIAQSIQDIDQTQVNDLIEIEIQKIRTKTFECVNQIDSLKKANDSRFLRIDIHGNLFLGDN